MKKVYILQKGSTSGKTDYKTFKKAFDLIKKNGKASKKDS